MSETPVEVENTGSSTAEHVDNSTNRQHIIKRGKAAVWEKVEEFESSETFEEYLGNLTIPLAKKKRYENQSGLKRHYRCTFKGCDYECRAWYVAHGEKVVLEQKAGNQHVHMPQNTSNKLEPEFKKKILEFNRLGVTPRVMLQELGPECMLTQKQVANFIQRSKKKGTLPKKLTVFDLFN